MPTLDAFTRGYLECALWTSDPDPGSGEWSERDGEWAIDMIDPSSLAKAIEACAAFQTANREDLDEVEDTYHVDASRNGHDFWLTRNRHGAGFWDRGYDRDLGKRLTEASHAYGEANIDGPVTNDQGGCEPEEWDRWDGVIYIYE